jgi:predicted membrane-bound spermidine synthase
MLVFALVCWCAVARSFSTDISESDLIYTETLMQRGKENYEGKEIVILGGGDGALLWELLKEKPKFVYMLEVGIFLMCCCLPTLFLQENNDGGISYKHIHLYNYDSFWSRC